jgi:nucleoside-diphosphate-sugar epimerase
VKVLVTGGTGVVGNASVTALLAAGHEVRLFSRQAEEDLAQWPEGVEARGGDIADAEAVAAAAVGCDAVLHIVGIVAEDPPDLTFERINIGGTRNIVSAARSAGVGRLVYVSSLGADRGSSDYHRSKLEAERVVQSFEGEWVIVRAGNVYGPGDEVISRLLRMVRALPVVPVLGDGNHEFQPVWHEDLGLALAQAVERPGLAGEVLEVAGMESTTMNDLIERFKKITDRSSVKVPVPMLAAELGARAAEAVGLELPVNSAQLSMLEEGNTIEDPLRNALTARFGIRAKPLSEGLLELADAQPVQTPESGYGKLKHRIVDVEIHNARYDAAQMFDRFRANFSDFVPIEGAAEPGTDDLLTEGATLTLALPLRGNIQVRVEESGDGVVTLATLEGHPLAGAVRFQFADVPTGLRFTINVADRPATALDYVAMALVGNAAQRAAWVTTAERVLEASGGVAPDGVRHAAASLDDEAAAPFQTWIETLVDRQLRRERAEETSR